ncbi:HAD family phosphatase [Tamlana sp. 2_MG-2023]|uniref:HAD family hydrolase n=1 Tax=unclassified Tamlana TaxID=2614803 RepID=UPI0026E2CC1A|nr:MULTISPECIES: HAD family phosphatase [unclassified Tamlana]MDO6759091.1 HAD family phosphatase [Tamlana sp. 2_MG-2023]MDO6789790.1 HAD family phosphatase [Tamlana sp. 1_MG-2023]
MIKTIIFDFGNVFINLDIPGAQKHAFETLEIDSFSEEIQAFNSFYEQGLISTDEFLDFYAENFPKLSREELKDVWNYMLKHFPPKRLEFIKTLKASGKYKLILLSNTNELHIDHIKEQVNFFDEFKNCFDKFYLSHEINLAKPNYDIFEYVLEENNLKAEECLFIDDNKDNIISADALNFKTWHINPETEDVCTLFETKSNLF